jgi:HEPN domain-containing protein
MPDRSDDWMSQAERDLEHARKDAVDKYYEHSCFGAQQAAEKAVKALYLRLKSEGWGHRVGLLLGELSSLGIQTPPALVDDGKILDQFYVPARCPNGFESGAPKDFFTEAQAADAVQRAQNILQWCKDLRSP